MARTNVEPDVMNDNRCFSVAMWDFSWLVRQQGQEAEYSRYDAILDQLVDRGYDCIRIDPFPHLLAGSVPSRPDEFVICPQDEHFMWGNHTPVKVSPRKALRSFLAEVKPRPVSIALSSWFLDDTTHRKHQVRTAQDYAEIWMRTLELIAEQGMLDRILWVDLCNEFPMSIWAPAPYQKIFRTSRTHGLMPSALLLGRRWDQRAIDQINRYFEQSIGLLKGRFPTLRYTFSFQEFGARNLRRVDLAPFDLIEAHIWLSDDLWWSLVSQHYKAAFGYRDGVRQHAARASQIFPAWRDRCRRVLDRRMQFWKGLADQYALPLVTSEGWVSTFYDDTQLPQDRDGWAWFKQLTEDAVELAKKNGWWGICSSNFCQPHFRDYWADRPWHQKMTRLIRS